jgi:hypothetical protein
MRLDSVLLVARSFSSSLSLLFRPCYLHICFYSSILTGFNESNQLLDKQTASLYGRFEAYTIIHSSAD